MKIMVTKYNCHEPHHFKVKEKDEDYWSNQKLLHHYQHVRKSVESSIRSWDKADVRVSWPEKDIPISCHAHQNFFKVTLNFHELISACTKSPHFINSFLRHSIFQGLITWKATPISDLAFTKIIKVILCFQKCLSACKKSTQFTNLKLVSAIFYQIFISHQMIACQKLWKMLFISSKKLVSFSRYSDFCISTFPSFSP